VAKTCPSPHHNTKGEVRESVLLPESADVCTVFYLARNNELLETYENEVTKTINALKRSEDFQSEILEVFTNLNFNACFIQGLEWLGQKELATAIRSKYHIDFMWHLLWDDFVIANYIVNITIVYGYLI
jgi:DNA topoisomerase VI subunit B